MLSSRSRAFAGWILASLCFPARTEPPQWPLLSIHDGFSATASQIHAPSSVREGTGGHLAWLDPRPGSRFFWKIEGGSLIAGQGTPFLIFQAGEPGILRLSCATVNAFDLRKQTAQVELSVEPLPNLKIQVREWDSLPRTKEIVAHGIPIPRKLGWTHATRLQLLDEKGLPVPAQMEVLSRWGGGLGSSQPIQWLWLAFPASLPALGSSPHRLVALPPAPVSDPQIQIQETAETILVETGPATFKLSKKAPLLIQEASIPEGKLLEEPGNLSLDLLDRPGFQAQAPDSWKLERAGPMFATVRASGCFLPAPFSQTVFRYVTRAHFRVGSPVVVVEFSFDFPGNPAENSQIWVNGADDLLTLNKLNWSLPHKLAAPLEAHVVGSKALSLDGPLATGQARLTQALRLQRDTPPVCHLYLAGQTASGGRIDSGFVGLKGANGLLAGSLERMGWYEPQAMEADAQHFQFQMLSDRAPLGPFMGAFTRLALGVFPAHTSWETAREQISTILEKPLVAWPQEAAQSGAMGELWDGTPHPDGAIYAAKLDRVNQNTLEGYARYGLHGFMTYGLPPRYWFSDPSYQEFGDSGSWNGYFLGATFTDYHHALSNPVRTFARTGDPTLLRALAFPAARRMLHTQIIQADPSGPAGTWAGWSPIAYGAYRSDFNSSHSYFENLFFYYFLTGDRRVLEILQSSAHRRIGHTRDADGTLVPSDQPCPSEWMGSADRVSSQLAAVYHFLGHAGEDASFLEDFRNVLDRMVDRHSALLDQNGLEYAFLSETDLAKTGGAHLTTGQAWMAAFYPLENLWRLREDLGNVYLGQSGIPLDRYLVSLGRSTWAHLATLYPGGTGEAEGVWANSLVVDWSGARMGGNLTKVDWNPEAPEPFLWLTGKATLTAFLARCGDLSGDPVMKARAARLTRYVLAQTPAESMAWGKEAGLTWTRLHAALARLCRDRGTPGSACHSRERSPTQALRGSVRDSRAAVPPGSYSPGRRGRAPYASLRRQGTSCSARSETGRLSGPGK